MAKSLVQLHITSAEFSRLLAEVIEEFGLTCVRLFFDPKFQVAEVRPETLMNTIDAENGAQFLLSPRSFDMTARNQFEFHDRNSGYITFDLGGFRNGKLRQSAIGYLTDESDTLEIGKKILRRVRKVSTAGVTVINPLTNEKAVSRVFRYTTGALELERSGVVMLPVGGNIIKLGLE